MVSIPQMCIMTYGWLRVVCSSNILLASDNCHIRCVMKEGMQEALHFQCVSRLLIKLGYGGGSTSAPSIHIVVEAHVSRMCFARTLACSCISIRRAKAERRPWGVFTYYMPA